MKQTFIILSIVISCLACEKKEQQEKVKQPFAYAENIKFNHLYVVIDDSTYNYLFDSIPFFNEFAYVNQADVDAGDESWSGKYVSGNQDYLEIFRPGGAEGTELGDFGVGFMPNKLGTVDSLFAYWKPGEDSITMGSREMVISEGNAVPWFNAVAIHDPDSLAITPWVMEYTETFMRMAGFTEEDLKREISHAEYSQRSFATKQNISFDSASYEKLYERVSGLSLNLSKKEYEHFAKYLKTFGFEESDNAFTRSDLIVTYQLIEDKHTLLKQIDFELRSEVEKQSHTFGSVTLNAKGREAQLIIE